jgi:hypothetical protein
VDSAGSGPMAGSRECGDEPLGSGATEFVSCSSLHDSTKSSDYITSEDRMISERMWTEPVVACFKVLFWHSPGGTEENHKISVNTVFPRFNGQRISDLTNQIRGPDFFTRNGPVCKGPK